MDADVDNPGKGGVKCDFVGVFIQGCGSGGYPIWVQDVGDNTSHGPESGGFQFRSA